MPVVGRILSGAGKVARCLNCKRRPCCGLPPVHIATLSKGMQGNHLVALQSAPHVQGRLV